MRAQFTRRVLVDRPIAREHDTVLLARRRRGYQLLEHIPAYPLRVALERIAPTATAARAHDHLRLLRHRPMAAVHGAKFGLARRAQQITAARAARPAP